MRLIDADAANVDSISCFYGDRAYLDDVQEWLNEQPTVDTVKHGRWLSVARGLRVKCSVCESGGESQPHVFRFYAYCPHCGAKMEHE